MKQEDRIKRVKEAEAIYESKLQSQLEPLHNGQYVAIELDSKDYFLGSSLREACLLGSKNYPHQKLVCLRVGYPATRFIGSHD